MSDRSRRSTRLLDLYEVAELLGVSHRTVQRYIESGQLTSIVIAHKRRVEHGAIDDYFRRKRDEAERERADRMRRNLHII